MWENKLKFLPGCLGCSRCLDYSGSQLKTQAGTQTQAHTDFEKLNHFDKWITDKLNHIKDLKSVSDQKRNVELENLCWLWTPHCQSVPELILIHIYYCQIKKKQFHGQDGQVEVNETKLSFKRHKIRTRDQRQRQQRLASFWLKLHLFSASSLLMLTMVKVSR